MVRQVSTNDASQIARIYNYYVRETLITFDTEEVSAQEMAQRIEKALHENRPYYVYERDGSILGYCYLGSWKLRNAYSKTAELTIYLDTEAKSQGIGTQLMEHLHANIDTEQYHAIVACITLPNEPSVRMHEKFGYTQVSHFSEVGRKFDKWVDVGDWQLVIV